MLKAELKHLQSAALAVKQRAEEGKAAADSSKQAGDDAIAAALRAPLSATDRDQADRAASLLLIEEHKARVSELQTQLSSVSDAHQHEVTQ